MIECQCEWPLIKCDAHGCRCTICGLADRLPMLNSRPIFKSITEFTDAELRDELHRRALEVLGDPAGGVSVSRPERQT